MALVWAKKSTGLPIDIRSATGEGKQISHYLLDLDIQANRPNILLEEKLANPAGWRGSHLSLVIGGKWASYQSKVLSYMRQLAVITPYAHLQLEYSDQEQSAKSWRVEFLRRTDVMPAPPLEVKHHPSSVDNLLVEQLMHQCSGHKLKQFLASSFSNISPALAAKLVEQLGRGFEEDMDIRKLDRSQIHQITALLRQTDFSLPDASVRGGPTKEAEGSECVRVAFPLLPPPHPSSSSLVCLSFL
jgi:DNA topoisomerase VI subunit B